MESQIFIKINEDKDDKNFSFFIPTDCSYEHVKKGILTTYEHVIRAEHEAIKAEQAKKASEEALAATPVEGEVV